MDEDEEHRYRRAFRQRHGRRADRALNNLEDIQELRALINDRANESGSSGSEEGEVSSRSEEESHEGQVGASDEEMDQEEQGAEEEGMEQGAEEEGMEQEENEAEDGQDVNQDELERGEEEEDSDNDLNRNLDEEELEVLNFEEIEQYVIQSLREWGTSGGVLSRTKIDELLGKLCFVFPNMPKSYKTLLSTAKTADILVTEDYKFWYKGIKKNLDQMNLDEYLQKYEEIEIDLNMDGLPLNKSSTKMKFWPILGKLVGTEDDPFIIAIYCGKKDPADVDLFLGELVLELNELFINGYNFRNRVIRFHVRDFILDAPARSLVKCCIGHTGYGACEKCTVHGVHLLDRINFALVGPDCRQRSDESFRLKEDRLHHSGRSPLELIGVGMVSQFRLDTLHLLYKGVFSRLLDAILTWEGPWNLDATAIRNVSNLLQEWTSSCPLDFNRKPRALEEWYKYKATELRRFLLYDAVVAFQDELDENVYKLLLLLHSSIYILASAYLLPLYSDNAEEYLNGFVNYAAQIFGDHFVSYNVHSLTHLVSECRTRGVVEEFSAFPYENALKSIKETLRSGYLPLEQVVKRDSERSYRRDVVLQKQENTVQLLGPHDNDQFSKIIVNKTTFKTGGKDSVFLTIDGQVVVLENIVCRDRDIFFVGNRFQDLDNLYSYPINSSELGICKVWNKSQIMERFPLTDVFAKCWLIKKGDYYVAMPLFVVVHFSDGDEEYEAVSRTWLHMDPATSSIQCWWPENTLTPSQLMAMVTKHQAPDKDWKSHPCEIMKSYGAYLDAHLGAKNRTKDKNYETEKELGIGRRKKTQSKRLVPLEEAASDRKVPKIVHSEKKSSAPASAPLKLPSPPKISTACGSSKTFKVGVKPLTIVSESKLSSSRPKSNQKTVQILRKNKGSKVSDLQDLKKLIDAKKLEATKGVECSKSPAEAVLKNLSKGAPHHTSVVEKYSDPTMSPGSDDETPSSQQLSEDEDARDENNRLYLEKNNLIGASGDHIRGVTASSGTISKRLHINLNTENLSACSNVSFSKSTPDFTMPDLNTEILSACSNVSFSKSTPDFTMPDLNSENLSAYSNTASVPRTVPDLQTCSSQQPNEQTVSKSATTSAMPDFELRVLRLLHTLNNKIENVALNQARLNMHLLPDDKVLKKPPGTPSFPIISWEDCTRMEKYLSKTENLADMSLYFSAYVSQDPKFEKKSTKDVLENFIGNCVAKKYSFKGRRGKLNFSTTPFWTVIKGALVSKIADTNLAEAEVCTKGWLKDAEYRVQEDGSESKRKEKGNEDETNNSRRHRKNVAQISSDSESD
ncbi:putative G-protein coupled receptor 101 [Frankliniella fusca]|uniref:G-protein coupled receptor 101 n=1 Tax=Frankliniella fusca TaxID=407009 RepID=A0AAE1I6Z5_9NEOP|nr:putative G-protein coupled receptor 101 [Frankliniella fusca]